MVFAMVFGIYGALIAYIVGEGESLATIFASSQQLLFSLGFFVLMAVLIYMGLRAIEKSELVLATLVVAIVVLIAVFVAPRISIANLTSFQPSKLFVPYGVILFALAGTIAIPEMKEEMTKDRRLLKRAIVIGALIPVALYIVFSFVVVGAQGLGASEVATTGLAEILGAKMFVLGNIFAVLAMATSFLTLGLALKEMYAYDFHLNEMAAWLATIIPPLLLFFALEKTFVGIIGLTGGVAMGIGGILVVLMYQQAKKKGRRKPEYKLRSNKPIEYGLMAIFFLGIIYTALNFIGVV